MSQSEQQVRTSLIPWKEIFIFLGAVLAALFGYLGVRASTVIPIQATQTAEAKLTSVAQPTAQSTPVEATLTLAPTDTISPTSPPTLTLSPSMTATPKPISITGIWGGITGGTKEGSPLTEVTTTVTIANSCQVGESCGFFTTYCTYEMTLLEIQGNVHIFETISKSGEDFCSANSGGPARAELTLVSESKLFFHYEASSGTVTREGVLEKQE